eukprot:TRINITY_DN36634_c0_g1_i2.p1 TRINITY_DN36634_c0_g1~~TRINITY_DN36634_c0_g1_i2.p1  ORF type:complete len:327 (-),score=58.88 TRINITY_DN36634_c0_g1_i2:89-1069(-)
MEPAGGLQPATKRPLKRARVNPNRSNTGEWSSRLSAMRARAEEVINTLREILERDLLLCRPWNEIVPKFSIALSRLRVLSDDIRRDLSHSVIMPARVGSEHTRQVPSMLRSKLDVEIEGSDRKHVEQLEQLFPEAFDEIPQFESLENWVSGYEERSKAADADVLPTRERAGLGQVRLNPYVPKMSSSLGAATQLHLLMERGSTRQGTSLRIQPTNPSDPTLQHPTPPTDQPGPTPSEIAKTVSLTPMSLAKQSQPILLHSGVAEMTSDQKFAVEYKVKPIVAVRRLLVESLSLIHISEPTRLLSISYAVFCLKKKKKKTIIITIEN